MLPWFCRFTDLAHAHGLQVMLHSCGSIYKVIERLVDAGVECLHPLQARAHNMDAETLARQFKGRISFMGGIDTQFQGGDMETVRDRFFLASCICDLELEAVEWTRRWIAAVGGESV